MIEIRWATAQELMVVSGEVPLNAPITDILDDWRTVAVVQGPSRDPAWLIAPARGRDIIVTPV